MKNIIKFSTVTCGPCKAYAPIFDKVSTQFPGVSFQALDANQNAELARKYGIRGVPATIFEKDGQEVNRLMGLVTEQQLTQAVKSL